MVPVNVAPNETLSPDEVLRGKPVQFFSTGNHPLWLAPHVYAPLWLYNTIALSLAIAYLAYGVLINASERVKKIYVPYHS